MSEAGLRQAQEKMRADRLEVRGDVAFGKDVVVVGDVELQAPAGARREIPDGAVLEG